MSSDKTNTTTTTTMFASVCTRYGPAGDVFELRHDLPRPVLQKDDDVLVEVHTTAVNPADCKQRSGNLQLISKHDFPLVLGQDFCGTVVAVGPGVSHNYNNIHVGDTVMGSTAPRNSCSAQYLVARAGECATIELKLDVDVDAKAGVVVTPAIAAATPTAYCTAWKGLNYLDLLPTDEQDVADHHNSNPESSSRKSSSSVLILGASGSVGSAAVQLAAGLGAVDKVVAVCGKDNLGYVESLSTETTEVVAIDYKQPGYATKLRQNHQKFDLVLDCVGGDEYYYEFHGCLNFANPRACYVTCVGPVLHGGSEPITPKTLLSTIRKLVPRLLGNYLLPGKWNSRYRIYLGFDTTPLPKVARALERGLIRPRIDPDAPFPLRELGRAHEKVETGHSSGKVVVEIRRD